MDKSPLGKIVRKMMEMKKKKSLERLQKSVKASGPVYMNKDGNVAVQVLAKPGAKSNGITGIEEEGVGVQINARPVEGEANTELVKYVTGVLGLKKNEVTLDKGLKSRQKVLLILRKDFTPEKVIEKLKEEMNQSS